MLGSDEEVIAQLTELCTRFPVDPLLLRPQWPSMSAGETIAAIERLGAKKDGVIRRHGLRRDGTVRDTVIYSIVRGEWPEIKAHLHDRLNRHAG